MNEIKTDEYYETIDGRIAFIEKIRNVDSRCPVDGVVKENGVWHPINWNLNGEHLVEKGLNLKLNL